MPQLEIVSLCHYAPVFTKRYSDANDEVSISLCTQCGAECDTVDFALESEIESAVADIQ